MYKKYLILVLFFIISLVGCKEENNIMVPDTIGPAIQYQQNEGTQYIDNRYIVVLHRGENPATIAKAHGLTEFRTYTHALNGFVVTIPNEKALNGLRNNPNVAYIEQDIKVTAFGQIVPTGIRRIQATTGTSIGNTDIDIAILDSGIDPNHPDLNVVDGIHYFYKTTGPPAKRHTYDYNYTDDNGHGSHVSGTIAAINNTIGVVGVVPGARLWAIKILDANGSGNLSDIVSGIDYVTANADKIEVANMSLGGIGFSMALHTALQNCVNAGVVVVVAAGNHSRDIFGIDKQYGTSDDVFPACYPEVATISAMADSDGMPGGAGGSTIGGEDDTFASFSNYSNNAVAGNPVSSSGAGIDLILPGVSIYSTSMAGGYATKSGTSMACPHATGLVAKYIVTNGRANDAAGVYAIRQALIDNGEDMFGTNGLVVNNDPDNNNENLGWAGVSGPQTPIAIAGNDVIIGDGDNNGIETVTVNASASYDPDGGILTYEWSNGGNILSTSAVYSADYSIINSPYTLNLTVTDDEGETAYDEIIITINPNQAPIAIAGNDIIVYEGDNANLDASDSYDNDGVITSYEWYKGTTLIGSDKVLSYIFALGTHNLYLIVTDNGGETSTDNIVVTVKEQVQQISITSISPNSGTETASISATITGTGFQSGLTVSFDGGKGGKPSANSITVVNSTTITMTIYITDGKFPKNSTWDITVTNSDDNSATLSDGFTVIPK